MEEYEATIRNLILETAYKNNLDELELNAKSQVYTRIELYPISFTVLNENDREQPQESVTVFILPVIKDFEHLSI